ncbi:MAG: DUF4405 domain-containing protein [Pirellulaceae bacterium]
MSRALLNFWLDVTLLITFLAGMWAEFVIRVVFPPGTTAQGWRLWGLTYDNWFDIQFWLWCIFALSVLLHIMLHWTWVCGLITSRILRSEGNKKRQWDDGERTLVGVGLLVAVFLVMGVGLAAAMFTVATPGT